MLINLFLFDIIPEQTDFEILTDNQKKQRVIYNNELHRSVTYSELQGEIKLNLFPKFYLEPNKHIFQFEFLLKKV